MIELELMFRLVVAAALGLLVGVEREKAGKTAGVRTNALVGLGSCLFTVTAVQYIPAESGRIIAAIATGVGFIGAGSLIAAGKDIKGVTTAASLWIVAAIGSMVGMGGYLLGATTAFLTFLILEARRLKR